MKCMVVPRKIFHKFKVVVLLKFIYCAFSIKIGTTTKIQHQTQTLIQKIVVSQRTKTRQIDNFSHDSDYESEGD